MAKCFYVIRHRPPLVSYLHVHFMSTMPDKAIGATVERSVLLATVFTSDTQAYNALADLQILHPVYNNFEVAQHPAVEK